MLKWLLDVKSRWRILLKHNELNYKFVPDVVATCCTIHTILETKKNPFLNLWEECVRENTFLQPENLSYRIYNDFNANQIRNVLRDHVAELLLE